MSSCSCLALCTTKCSSFADVYVWASIISPTSSSVEMHGYGLWGEVGYMRMQCVCFCYMAGLRVTQLYREKKYMHVANLPTCGPLVILSPALKHWGPPRQQRLCSQSAHLWATGDFVPRPEALGTPQTAAVM